MLIHTRIQFWNSPTVQSSSFHPSQSSRGHNNILKFIYCNYITAVYHFVAIAEYTHVHLPYVFFPLRCIATFTSSVFQTPPSNSGRPRIVAAQSEALERNKRRPQIVAKASKRGTRPRVRMILMTVTTLTLGLFVLYESFPLLTAGLRGCAYYLQRLATVTVSLVRALSSRR